MKKSKLVLFLFIIIFAISAPGLAQEIEKEKEKKVFKLEEIVVTAPEVKGAPGRTTLITKEEINIKNTQNAIKILEHIPGVHLRPEKRRGGRISMRGIGETKIVILLDDSILNDSFHQNVFWNIVPIETIERVEVIPGPFSALYGGRGGIGGTVKFITKMPEKEEFFNATLLHDSVKQQSFAAAAQISAAKTLLKRNPEAAETHIQEAERLTYDLRQELTNLIQELRPAALEGKGLARAVREYAADWSQQNGIPLDVRVQGERALSLEIEQAVYRMVQEALSNIARHSQASSVARTRGNSTR